MLESALVKAWNGTKRARQLRTSRERHIRAVGRGGFLFLNLDERAIKLDIA